MCNIRASPSACPPANQKKGTSVPNFFFFSFERMCCHIVDHRCSPVDYLPSFILGTSFSACSLFEWDDDFFFGLWATWSLPEYCNYESIECYYKCPSKCSLKDVEKVSPLPSSVSPFFCFVSLFFRHASPFFSGISTEFPFTLRYTQKEIHRYKVFRPSPIRFQYFES